jgi:hypothetical protein
VKPVLLLAALLLLATGCGTRPEDAIQNAIRSSPDVRAVREQGLHIDVWKIRISRSDPSYATALVRGRDHSGAATVGTALVYLRRTDRWRVIELGSAMVYPDCKGTPRGVVMDLFGGQCFVAGETLKQLH